MKMNTGKTKVMQIGKEKIAVNKTLEGKKLEQVKSFRYLGSLLTWNGSCTEEIRSRITLGKEAFGKVRGLLTSKAIPMDLRRRFAKCFMWSGVSYRAEMWTLRKKETKYL